MTLIVSFLVAHLGWIIGALGVAGGVLFGWAKGKAADTKTAQAGAQVAVAQQQTADAANAEAQANAAASQAGAAAVKVRTGIDNTVAAKSADEVRNELANWTRD